MFSVMMTSPKCVLFSVLFLLGLSAVVKSELPSYIHVCHRGDPKVEECVLNSVQDLLPRLKKGLPEIGIPAIEPLLMKEIEVANGNDAAKLRIYAHDVLIHGVSAFKVRKLKMDFSDESKPKFILALSIPSLELDGHYDLNARLIVLPLKGKGNIHINATNVFGEAVIHTNLYEKDGKQHINFGDVDMKLEIEDFDIKLANLFSGQPTLSQVANRIIKENKRELVHTLQPAVTRTVTRILQDIANKMARNHPYDELFPL